MTFMIKGWQKDTAGMRYGGYPKEIIAGNDPWVLERHFKLDVKNRFLMLLVYYRLYTTYALAGFLFDLDQSNVCRDI